MIDSLEVVLRLIFQVTVSKDCLMSQFSVKYFFFLTTTEELSGICRGLLISWQIKDENNIFFINPIRKGSFSNPQA